MVRAEIEISEQAVTAIDVCVPAGHRAEAFDFLARTLPALKELDRSLKVPASDERSDA
jgi:hypothetical protein